MRFSFVILHYNSLEETIKCVDSIKATQNGLDYKIVIVDNCSPDGSGKNLDQLWSQENLVTIIHCEKNLGFARGNNIGFHFAKYDLHSDFIVLLNADTMVLQDDFQKIVVEEYGLSGFAVLGPFVKTPHPPFNSNPGPDTIPSVAHFKKKLNKYRAHLFLTYIHLDKFLIKLHRKQARSILMKNIDKINDKVYNVRLHGCFMVFSPVYLAKFDGLNDKTFLFGEEDLLFIRLKRCALISVYLPQVVVFHKEDASTDNSFVGENKKNRFVYKCKIQSTRIIIKELTTN